MNVTNNPPEKNKKRLNTKRKTKALHQRTKSDKSPRKKRKRKDEDAEINTSGTDVNTSANSTEANQTINRSVEDSLTESDLQIDPIISQDEVKSQLHSMPTIKDMMGTVPTGEEDNSNIQNECPVQYLGYDSAHEQQSYQDNSIYEPLNVYAVPSTSSDYIEKDITYAEIAPVEVDTNMPCEITRSPQSEQAFYMLNNMKPYSVESDSDIN